MYIHFTPEYFGQQAFSEKPMDEDLVFIEFNFFATERNILFHALELAGLHVRILLVFDAVFDNIATNDPGWRLLRTTFDQLVMDLHRDLPPMPST